MKPLLLFLAGLLAGANLVYFVMARRAPDCAPQPAAAGAPAPPRTRADREAAAPKPAPAPTPPAANGLPAPRGLLLPVPGVRAEQLRDTFAETRDGARPHEALDILAPRGTPVLAAADGSVAKLFTSARGGLTVYQFDPSGTWAYYYAHLDRYAPGLAEGQALRRGEVIGYVGSSGNASADAPHLHFAVFVLGPEKRWWEGTPIDPYPLLGGAPATAAR